MKIFIFYIALISLFTGCSPQNKNMGLSFDKDGKKVELKKEETLIVNIGPNSPVFNWTNANTMGSFVFIENIVSSLTQYAFEKGESKIVPALAEKWSHDPSGKSWTFSLRKDVQWSDGKPLVAQHFLDEWHYVLDPQNASPFAEMLFVIKNAESFYNNKTTFDQVGVRKIGDHQIQIDLEYPVMHFPKLLTHMAFAPIRLDFINKYPKTWYTRMDLPVVGPFKPFHMAASGEIYLERNPKYFEKTSGVKYIKFTNMENARTAMGLLERGKLDINIKLPSGVTEKDSKYLKFRKSYAKYVLVFNLQKPLFNSPEVRRIFVKSLDRKQLDKVVGFGMGALSTLYPDFHKSADTFPKLQGEITDKDLALLEPLKGIKVHFPTFNSGVVQLVSTNLMQQFKEKLNVDIELELLTDKLMFDKFKKGDFDISLVPFSFAIDHPFYSMELALESVLGWKNDTYKSLLRKAISAPTEDQAIEFYKKAESFYQQESPSTPILSRLLIYQVRDRVQNFETGRIRKFLFKNVSLNPKASEK